MNLFATTKGPRSAHRASLLRLVVLLLLILTQTACGDRFYRLAIHNHRKEAVVVFQSDLTLPMEIPACGERGGAMAYSVGEKLTIRVATKSGTTIYLTTLELGSVDSGGPGISIDLPAEGGPGCG